MKALAFSFSFLLGVLTVTWAQSGRPNYFGTTSPYGTTTTANPDPALPNGTASSTWQRDFDQARQEKERQTAAALDPINRHYREVLEQLLGRATQGHDLETALKIKAELAHMASPSTLKFGFVRFGSAAPQPKGYRQENLPVMETDRPEDVLQGKPVYFDGHTGKDIIFSVASPTPLTKLIYRGVAFSHFNIRIHDGTGRELAKTGDFNDGNQAKTIELPLAGLQNFSILIHNESGAWTLINEIRFE